ncbi:CapA family protein [Sinorhizobium alkalisoli]|uniref:Poly-gamma-glutamate biosynthesis protein n=1 Tax=Sinorhizobium alkalisoli TaxID=1752398 RepID=A0A1E3V7G2_9HYPH|nr:CapA family protein [Sinorhizobium alkalisoli]MCA1490523.1 CapA family protein [Ensifer sp. NBAIM29]ODR89510.1 poly-gamma-glutamate biosynthesis protein [Sinorhizobium alkalisoli]
MSATRQRRPAASPEVCGIRLFLCGDVMTGRGIDQVLPAPCGPAIHETYLSSAFDYVRLAELAHGQISWPVEPSYIWGVALDEFERAQPCFRIVNLETAVTHSIDHAAKGINYRMSPQNASCLVAAGIDCCVLANNHVLDWGLAGLYETLSVLHGLQIGTAGAGRDRTAAEAPAVLDAGGDGRVLVFALATPTSGTPRGWAAAPRRAGVNFLPDLAPARAHEVAAKIVGVKRPGDVAVLSLHWGPNWGYEVSAAERKFAHALIEEADVSIVYGHSSHHPRPIEVYRNRLILYGCGDFINDYEGIAGYVEFRGDLRPMYFVRIDPVSGDLLELEIVPLQARRFRLVYPTPQDIEWLMVTLERESRPFSTGVERQDDGRIGLVWPRA